MLRPFSGSTKGLKMKKIIFEINQADLDKVKFYLDFNKNQINRRFDRAKQINLNTKLIEANEILEDIIESTEKCSY